VLAAVAIAVALTITFAARPKTVSLG